MDSAPLQPGDRLGPYEIVSFIAAGGMGQVYKARDTRLDRLVALKRLTNPHAARFTIEAHAIASLNHPNICQLYDVGPDYLVMELIDGHPLAGPLPVAESVRVALQIASAVEAAHARGVLHRDLKPGNVMVTAHGAKLLDFGLAKPLTTDVDVTRTLDGTVVGTMAYMSPEQAEGRPLDERSDVFSFGVVLYELLSGRRAFPGETALTVLRAVADTEPPSLDVPRPLEHVLRRCLMKKPADRFSTMKDVRIALEQVAAALTAAKAASLSSPSIAVLPFANTSGDLENEYFSDGLAEEIINALTHIPGLRVIARTSAFAFKGRNEDIRRIAETLGVAHILEGSVRKAGQRIRVSAQLITAVDGTHLWSERYDRDLEDVFAIQDDIARAIASALRVKLLGPEAGPRRYIPSVAAYEAFLKGRYEAQTLSPDSIATSQRLYRQAIELDPRFPEPHVYLAGTFYTLGFLGIRPMGDVVALVRTEVQAALVLDPDLPDAHAALATLAALYDYDWKEAEAHYRLATAREPVPVAVRYFCTLGYLLSVRPEEGLAQMDRAVSGDPLNVGYRHMRALCLLALGRNDDAIAAERACLELKPKNHPSWVGLAMAFEVQGQFADALEAAQHAHALAPFDGIPMGHLAGLLIRAGEPARAEHLLRGLPPLQMSFASSICYVVAGDIDRAADHAERAIRERAPGIVGHLQMPFAGDLRRSARWPALANLMNLSQIVGGGA